jgi:hypothetical protein
MRKSTKYAIVAVVLIVILYVAGVFGAIAAFLSTGGAPAPTAGASWDAKITSASVATAAETTSITPDGKQVSLFSGLADWKTVADNDNIALIFNLINQNEGSSQTQYVAEVSISSVPQPGGGAGTSYIVLRDGNGDWDVAYTGTGVTDSADEGRVVMGSLATVAVTATMEASAAGFDNFQLAGNYDLVLQVADIDLTMTFIVSGA